MTIGVVGTLAGSLVGPRHHLGCRTPSSIIRLAGDVYQIDYLPMKLTLRRTSCSSSAPRSSCRSSRRSFPPAAPARSQPVDVLRYE